MTTSNRDDGLRQDSAREMRVAIAMPHGRRMLEGMDWQQTTALGIVAVTAGAMWAGWRRRRRAGASGCGCGGCGGSSSAPRETTVLRGRKGERPEWVVRPQ